MAKAARGQQHSSSTEQRSAEVKVREEPLAVGARRRWRKRRNQHGSRQQACEQSLVG